METKDIVKQLTSIIEETAISSNRKNELNQTKCLACIGLLLADIIDRLSDLDVAIGGRCD